MRASVLLLPPAQPAPTPPATLAERLDRIIGLLEVIAAQTAAEAPTVALPHNQAQLIDQAELAELLRLQPRTIRRMEIRGELPPSGLSGRKRTYDRDEINRWLRAGRPKRDEWLARSQK